MGRLGDNVGVRDNGHWGLRHVGIGFVQSFKRNDATRDSVVRRCGRYAYEWNSLTRRTKLCNIDLGATAGSKHHLRFQFHYLFLNRPNILYSEGVHNELANINSCVVEEVRNSVACNMTRMRTRYHKCRFGKAEPFTDVADKL